MIRSRFSRIILSLCLGLALGQWLACAANAEKYRVMRPLQEEDASSLVYGARERNLPYQAPSAAELQKSVVAGRALLNQLGPGHALISQSAAGRSQLTGRLFGQAHFALVGTQLGGGLAVAIREAPDHRRGGGVYIFRRGAVPRERLVQIPHSFFDVGTLEIGMELANAAQARALFVNTVHRFQGGKRQAVEDDGPVDAPADLAHQEQTFFQSFTIAALAMLHKPQVLQLHGFADGAVPECPQALVVVSPGAAPAGAAEAAEVTERLACLLGKDKVLLYPRDTQSLGAQRNVQGRAVGADGRASFLHLELSHTLRNRLLEDPSLCHAFIAAVIGSEGGAQ